MPYVGFIEETTIAGGQGINNINQLFSAITGWVTEIVTTISSNPLLLLTVGIFVVGAVIGLAMRLIRS